MTEDVDPLAGTTGFDWDEGNLEKNWIKHRVRWTECEEVFSHRPLRVSIDLRHSKSEQRYGALGQSARGRRLAVFFTIRRSLIRVIAARDMHWGEVKEYEDAEEAEANPKVQ